ncbi:MAG TPA: amino acid permease [Bacteroidota bacterium]|nr:amino acid permease [Bacteroidota bacterium]
METNAPSKELKKELNLFDSTMLVVGSMIGSGIFIVSADIARSLGSSGYLLLTWIVTGVMTIIAALSYGELAGMMPHVGGQYAYLKEAYNPFIGFLYGWALFLVIQSGTIAAVAMAFAKFFAVFVPALGEQSILVSFHQFHISAAQCIAIASIALLTFINMHGLTLGKMVQNIFTSAKIIALAGIILLGIIFFHHSSIASQNFSSMWNASSENGPASSSPLSGFALIAAFGVAMVGSLFSSDAWNNITFTAGEVKNPKRTIPLSLVFGVGIVTLIYVLTNVAYLSVLPIHGDAHAATAAGRGIQYALNDRVGTAAAESMFGDVGALLMASLIMISTFGCNNGLILAGARVTFAMAKDGLFFRSAGTLNKNSVPSGALLVQGIWASILCLSGTYGNLLDYVIFVVLLFYVLTIAGVFILRKKSPGIERPYKTFGYPVVPILYIVLALSISIDLLIFKPQYTWPGLIIVLLGVPVYFVWKKMQQAA